MKIEVDRWRTAHDIPAPTVGKVERMLSSWLRHRRVLSVQMLPGGLMNRNCRIEIESMSEPVVLRLYDRDPASCATELAVLELVRTTVPVPSVLDANPEPHEEHPPFALLEFIRGTSIKALTLSGDRDALATVAYEVGLLLARLTSFRFAAPGALISAPAVSDNLVVNAPPATAQIASLVESSVLHRRLAPPLRDRLVDVLETTREAPTADVTLVHGDFNSRNVLVGEVCGRWTVTALLDWEYAFAGSFLCDIGHFLRYERSAFPRFEPMFSQGCRAGGLSLDDDWRRAARWADLLPLCRLLACESTPTDVVREVTELVSATLEWS